MEVDCFSTPEIFDDIADEWEGIIPKDRSDTLFTKPGWQKIWWDHLGSGELVVLTVRTEEDDVLRGVASWFITEHEGQRSVHYVGCEDVVDYLDLIAQPEHINAVADAVLSFMTSSQGPAWDYMDLCNMPESSPAREALLKAAEKLSLNAEMRIQEVCPVVHLPDSYDAYLDTLDSKQRKELRRKRKRLAPYEVDCYLVGPEHDLDEEMEAFLELMAASTPEKEKFLEEPGHRALFQDVAHYTQKEGLLDLIMLKIDGVRVAGMLQFGYHDRMLLYNSGLKPGKYGSLSPGIVLLTYSIENAIERNFKQYDFLRGDEDYKFRMGAEATNIYNITITRA